MQGEKDRLQARADYETQQEYFRSCLSRIQVPMDTEDAFRGY